MFHCDVVHHAIGVINSNDPSAGRQRDSVHLGGREHFRRARRCVGKHSYNGIHQAFSRPIGKISVLDLLQKSFLLLHVQPLLYWVNLCNQVMTRRVCNNFLGQTEHTPWVTGCGQN